jgi:hypothetical protein
MMREQILTSSIPAIPREAIENSFTRNRIVGRELLEAAPYIVSNLGDNLAIATGDEVHVRGNWPEGTTSFFHVPTLKDELLNLPKPLQASGCCTVICCRTPVLADSCQEIGFDRPSCRDCLCLALTVCVSAPVMLQASDSWPGVALARIAPTPRKPCWQN